MTVKYRDGEGNLRHRKNNGEAGSSGDPDTFVGTIETIEEGASADLDAIRADIALIKAALAAKLPTLGQAAMAASQPVAIASNQSAVPISGIVLNGGPSWTQDITPTSSADMSASPANLTPAPTTGQHTVVESVTVSAAVPMVLTLIEETTLVVIKVFNLTSGNLNAEWNPTNSLRLPQLNKKLQGQTDGAGQVDITVISHSAL